MDPITAVAAISAASTLAKAYMDARARKDEKARLDEIKRAFDEIAPPDLEITDADILEKLEKYKQVGDIELPENIWENVTPGSLNVLEEFTPEIANLAKEKNPQLVERSAIGQEGLDAQRKALRRLMGISETSQDPALMQQLAQAGKQAQIQAQSREQSALQDYARRGILGSGLQMASDIGSQANAMERSAMQSQDAAAEAYRNRLNALMQGAKLGGQMEATDLNLQGKNTNIINEFNRRTSRAYNDWLRYKADQLNRAQLENLSAKERELGYKTAADQQAYQNKVGAAKYDNTVMQNAYNEAIKNRMVPYDIAMDKVKAKAGLPTVKSAWETPATILQGAHDIGQNYYGQVNADKYRQDQIRRDDAGAYFERYGKWPEGYTPGYQEKSKTDTDIF